MRDKLDQLSAVMMLEQYLRFREGQDEIAGEPA
jgi:hypothetical protein